MRSSCNIPLYFPPQTSTRWAKQANCPLVPLRPHLQGAYFWGNRICHLPANGMTPRNYTFPVGESLRCHQGPDVQRT
ncbi:hypothetical protein D3C73_572890 [compost metagenome]